MNLDEMKYHLRKTLAAGRKKPAMFPTAEDDPRSTCPSCGAVECTPVRWPVVKCACGCVWTYAEKE